MIEIDSREKHQRATDFGFRLTRLCKSQGIPSEVTLLDSGDIRFISRYLEVVRIERKSTAGDLFSSSNQRLQEQCLRLIDNADFPILLLDGPLSLGKGGYFKQGRFVTGWKFSSIAHILLTLQQRGLLIVHCPSSRYTPQEVIDLYHYFQKSDHTSLLNTILKPFPTTPKGLSPREQKMRILMAFPSIGAELAGRLIDIYGSPEAVINAPLDGLASIPGMGKGRANAIKEIGTTRS